jgi:hypothetical protein
MGFCLDYGVHCRGTGLQAEIEGMRLEKRCHLVKSSLCDRLRALAVAEDRRSLTYREIWPSLDRFDRVVTPQSAG